MTDKYQVLEAASAEQLSRLVQRYLDKGWKCQGGVSASDITGCFGGKSTVYTQAVIKKVKK